MFDNIFNILTPTIDKPVKTADDSVLFDTTFQLPIFYTDKLQLSADIIKDLELRVPNGANNGITDDKDGINHGIYKVLFDIKGGDIFKTQMVKSGRNITQPMWIL